MMKVVWWSFCILGLALALAGCGEKGCFVVAKDAKGIQAKAPVVWQDAYAGQVLSVAQHSSGSRVSLELKKEFAGRIHAGVVARIVHDDKISGEPFILLVGGNDASMPLLDEGAQIPEANAVAEIKNGFAAFMQWVSNTSHTSEKVGCGLLLVLLVVLRFVKKVVKLLVKLLILIVLLLVVVLANRDWSDYRTKVVSASEQCKTAQTWVSDHAESLKKAVQQVYPSQN